MRAGGPQRPLRCRFPQTRLRAARHPVAQSRRGGHGDPGPAGAAQGGGDQLQAGDTRCPFPRHHPARPPGPERCARHRRGAARPSGANRAARHRHRRGPAGAAVARLPGAPCQTGLGQAAPGDPGDLLVRARGPGCERVSPHGGALRRQVTKPAEKGRLVFLGDGAAHPDPRDGAGCHRGQGDRVRHGPGGAGAGAADDRRPLPAVQPAFQEPAPPVVAETDQRFLSPAGGHEDPVPGGSVLGAVSRPGRRPGIGSCVPRRLRGAGTQAPPFIARIVGDSGTGGIRNGGGAPAQRLAG